MSDQVYATESSFVTPKVRRSSATSVVTNPYRGDQGRYPATPYVTYAETGKRGQSSGVEEIDNSCVVYVGGLTNMTDDRILYDTFRQFGSIVSLVRRSVNFDVRPNSTMTQYAFIGFGSAQDAQKAIQTGEITLDNRKLIIKPRDKPGVSYHKHISHELHSPQVYKTSLEKNRDEGRDQILRLLQKSAVEAQSVLPLNATYGGQQQQHGQQAQKQQQEHRTQHGVKTEQQMSVESLSSGREPVVYYDGCSGGPARAKVAVSNTGQAPVLMSRSLSVANVPIDMSPKELYTMFSEVGHVEGCYIFPFADPMNRRFAHLDMGTFYLAQKAHEMYDGYVVRGCTFDVTYRSHTEYDTNSSSSPVTPYDAPFQPVQQQFPQFQQSLPSPGFPTPIYHQAFQASPPNITWLPQPYGPAPPGIIGPPGMMPFPHQFPPYQNMIQFAPYNPMGPMSPFSYEAHHSHVSLTNSPPYQNMTVPNLAWQGQTQAPNNLYQQTGRSYGPRRQHGRINGRHFLSSNQIPNFTGDESHIRSVSDSSSATLVSSGYENTKYHAPFMINGSYTGSPVIANGSYTESCETPSHNSVNEDMSESDKDSTPSPVVVRSIPDPQLTPETPTRTTSRATFEVLTAPIIPETTEPADPANLYIKNLDDAVISDVEDLKLLFVPYGPVASSFLSTYPGSGISRGYGFVAFANQEDAATAKTKLNGTMVGKKRVFISYAERKEDRTQRLKGLFGGDKGDSKKGKDKNKIVDETHEDSSDGEILENTKTNEHILSDDKAAVTESTDDTLSSRGLLLTEGENSVADVVKPCAEKVVEIPGNGIRSTIAEQEIAATTRWRGTQLTGIAETAEEEDISRVSVLQDNPSPPTNLSYVAPCIVHSPTYIPRGLIDNSLIPPTASSQPPMALGQQNSLIPPPRDTSLGTSIGRSQQNRNISLIRSDGQPHQQRQTNNSLNHSSDGHRDFRGAYGQRPSQGYYQGNGSSNGNARPSYRNNNGGSNINTKSMLPVPRNLNGAIQVTPVFMAPNNSRVPYFDGGMQQPFYPSYPNNEPIGQHYQGRKNNRKSPGRGRARDNNPPTHHTRIQNTQMNSAVAGGAEMMTVAF